MMSKVTTRLFDKAMESLEKLMSEFRDSNPKAAEQIKLLYDKLDGVRDTLA